MAINFSESKNGLLVNENNDIKSPVITIVKILLKIVGVLSCLYFFVVSLNLMSTSFPLIAGRYASEAFRSNVVLTNPLAGLMIGVLATVVVQSSSTSTSIIVSMVASEIVPVKYAIPIIMGSNIGTSITSTLVALSQAADKERFRMSFAGATVHDMFNLLTVSVLLPVEILFGILENLSAILVKPIEHNNPNAKEPEMLNAITKPLTEAIIQIDKHILDSIATNKSYENASLIKRMCKKPILTQLNLNQTNFLNITYEKYEYVQCKFLFKDIMWPEWLIGLILLIVSLLILSTCLVCLVKILSSIFNGPVAKVIQKIVNSDLPGVFRHLTGFIAILLGSILTVIVQSSSVFTSTLTPLVGMGLVTLERVFPLTLGSNIGTTITGILASISGPAKTLKFSLQIALCHTLFNILGILIWYPIPQLRAIPLRLAKSLGDTTAEYRWFAILYLIGLFFIIPLITFGLSILGKYVLLSVLSFMVLLILSIITINFMKKRMPNKLPVILHTWDFLPDALRSLKPYDLFIKKYFCFMECCNKFKLSEPETNKEFHIVVHSNKAFETESF